MKDLCDESALVKEMEYAAYTCQAVFTCYFLNASGVPVVDTFQKVQGS